MFLNFPHGPPNDIVIECPAQSPVCCYNHQVHPANFPFLHQRILKVAALGHQVLHHFADFEGVGAGRQNIFLSTAHLGSRHHFHGLGDLLRAFNTANAPFYFT